MCIFIATGDAISYQGCQKKDTEVSGAEVAFKKKADKKSSHSEPKERAAAKKRALKKVNFWKIVVLAQ